MKKRRKEISVNLRLINKKKQEQLIIYEYTTKSL